MKISHPKRAHDRLTAHEAALKVGLLGCMEGPSDLALNHRKYVRRAVHVKHRRGK
jgi:hypothetical protein